ncbi:MAG: GDYXXLXY domain-containing protein [Actinobacteria bacterium]|nr:GDYXXLXY domain-containing protein [Actinomycetota bacterium]
MKKRIILIIFIAICLFQLFIPLNMLFKVYYVKNDSKRIKIKTVLFDPINPMKGRYLQLSFPSIEKININYSDFKEMTKEELKNLTGKEVYICFKNSKNYGNYAEITKITEKKPEKGTIYLKEKIDNTMIDYKINEYDSTSDYLSFKYPFERYYLQEDIAIKTESYLRSSDSQKNEILFDLEISVNSDGDYTVESLSINNIRVEDFFNDKK